MSYHHSQTLSSSSPSSRKLDSQQEQVLAVNLPMVLPFGSWFLVHFGFRHPVEECLDLDIMGNLAEAYVGFAAACLGLEWRRFSR